MRAVLSALRRTAARTSARTWQSVTLARGLHSTATRAAAVHSGDGDAKVQRFTASGRPIRSPLDDADASAVFSAAATSSSSSSSGEDAVPKRRGRPPKTAAQRLEHVERAVSRGVQYPRGPGRDGTALHRGSSSGGKSVGGSSTVGISEAERRKLPLWIRRRPQRIYLLRHGESLGNVDQSSYSTVPDNRIPLTDRGLEQARDAGATLKRLIGDETVDFYVSPYVRTRQTAQQIGLSFSKEQIKMYEEPRLREQDFGNLQDAERMKKAHAEREKFGSFYYRFPQGESGCDVYDRVSGFMETMHRRFTMMNANERSNVVLVSHGLTIRLFLMRYFHWQVEFFQTLWNTENCQIVAMDRQMDGRYLLATPLRLNPDGALWLPPDSQRALAARPQLRDLYHVNDSLFRAHESDRVRRGIVVGSGAHAAVPTGDTVESAAGVHTSTGASGVNSDGTQHPVR